MAPVNPNLQDGQPPNPGFFQSLSPFALNKIGELGGKSYGADIGKDIVLASKGADEVVKRSIDDTVNTGVDYEREGYTGALEQIAGVPPQNRVADYQPDIMGNPSGDAAPASLNTSLRPAGSLAGSFNNGKLSPTYYKGRLDMLAKDVRSQYPSGYRDYIDKRISEETGGNPANQYIAEMLQGINAGMSGTKAQQGKDWTLMEDAAKAGFPPNEVGEWSKRVQSGLTEDDRTKFVQWYAGHKTVQNQAADAEAKFKKASSDNGVDVLNATTTFRKLADKTINNTSVNLGRFGNLPMDKMGEFVEGIQNGSIDLGKNHDEVALQLRDAFQGMQTRLEAQLHQVASQAGISKVLGESLNTEIQGRLSLVKATVASLGSKDFGAGFRNFRANEAITDDTLNQDLFNSTDTTTRNYSRLSAAMVKSAGPNGTNLIFRQTSAIPSGVATETQRLLQRKELPTILENQTAKVLTEGVSVTQAIQELNKGGLGVTDPNKPANDPANRAKAAERSAFTGMTTGFAKIITHPDIPDGPKLAAVKGLYGPGNENFINTIAPDGVNDKGIKTPGQHAVLDGISNQNVVDSIWKLNQEYPEQAPWDTFKVQMGRQNRRLLGGDVSDLNRFAANPDVQFGWNTDDKKNPKLQTIYRSSSSPLGGNVQVEDRVNMQRRVDNVNTVISSMARIANKEGTDPNAFILNELIGLGLDPQSPVSKKIFDAIKFSQAPTADPFNNKVKTKTQDRVPQ